jgi:hypothetical protein
MVVGYRAAQPTQLTRGLLAGSYAEVGANGAGVDDLNIESLLSKFRGGLDPGETTSDDANARVGRADKFISKRLQIGDPGDRQGSSRCPAGAAGRQDDLVEGNGVAVGKMDDTPFAIDARSAADDNVDGWVEQLGQGPYRVFFSTKSLVQTNTLDKVCRGTDEANTCEGSSHWVRSNPVGCHDPGVPGPDDDDGGAMRWTHTYETHWRIES